MRHKNIQRIRRTIQFSVLLLLVTIPILSHYEVLRNQRDTVGIESQWGPATIDYLLGWMEEPEKVTSLVRGSVWSMKIKDYVISDPLAVADFAAASHTVWDKFILTTLIPVLITLLLGRIFCGWICPIDPLFEFGSILRKWMRIKQDVVFPGWIKYVVLFLGILLALLLHMQIFPEFYPPRIISGELYTWLTFGMIGIGSWFIFVIFVFEIFISKRFWCRYVCPGGALYSLLGRFRLLRIKRADGCNSCERCDEACEFDLKPMSQELGMECNNCGACIPTCDLDILKYTWRII